MTITVPEELGQRLTAIAAKKGEGVHNFAVAALERAADEAQIYPSANGTQEHALTNNLEDFGLGPVIDTPEQAILRARLMALVGQVQGGSDSNLSENTGEKFADYLMEKHRQGRL